MERRRLLRLLGSLTAALPVMGVAAKPQINKSRSLLVLDSRIAGFAHYEGRGCVAQIEPGDALTLRRESGNPHDHRAIEIFWGDKKLGYVPRSHNRALYKLMDAGEMVVGEVKRIDDESREPLYFLVRVMV